MEDRIVIGKKEIGGSTSHLANIVAATRQPTNVDVDGDAVAID